MLLRQKSAFESGIATISGCRVCITIPELKTHWLQFESASPRCVAKDTWEGTAWHEFHQHKFPQSRNSSE